MGWGGETNVTVRYIDFERYITVVYDFNLMFSFTYISIQTVNITFKSAGYRGGWCVAKNINKLI